MAKLGDYPSDLKREMEVEWLGAEALAEDITCAAQGLIVETVKRHDDRDNGPGRRRYLVPASTTHRKVNFREHARVNSDERQGLTISLLSQLELRFGKLALRCDSCRQLSIDTIPGHEFDVSNRRNPCSAAISRKSVNL